MFGDILDYLEDWFGSSWWVGLGLWIVLIALIWGGGVRLQPKEATAELFRNMKIMVSIIMFPICLLITKAMGDD